MITFNLEEISKAMGVEFETQDEVVDFLESMRDYFRHHNKNLTSQQYQFIQGFTSIIDAVEKY